MQATQRDDTELDPVVPRKKGLWGSDLWNGPENATGLCSRGAATEATLTLDAHPLACRWKSTNSGPESRAQGRLLALSFSDDSEPTLETSHEALLEPRSGPKLGQGFPEFNQCSPMTAKYWGTSDKMARGRPMLADVRRILADLGKLARDRPMLADLGQVLNKLGEEG